ncbi:MAG: hypothetical protein AAFX41_03375 [Bacteroidota bacterium]
MDLLQAIGLVGVLASVAGLVYAFYYAKRSQRIKLFAYESSLRVPLATAVSPEDGYELSVLFKKANQEPELIEGVDVQFIRFANLGREPIRRADIAPSNPVRIRIFGPRVLDISLAGSNRSVTNIGLSELVVKDDVSESSLTFDFLDHKDGGTIKVISAGGKGSAQIVGDVIGMPDGIKRVRDIKPRNWLGGLGIFLSVTLWLSAFAACAFAYKVLLGSWAAAWLMILPIVALILPLVLVLIVSEKFWPSNKPALPETLSIPKWFYSLRSRHTFLPPDMIEGFADDFLIDNQNTKLHNPPLQADEGR